MDEKLESLKALEGDIVSVSIGDISAAAYGYMTLSGLLKHHDDFWTVRAADESASASFMLDNVVWAQRDNCVIHINPSVHTAVRTLAGRTASAV